jgi:hypothetical protein
MTRGFLTLLAGLGSLVGLGTTAAEPLEIGKPIPEVEGQNQKGEKLQLHEVAAKGWALFYFYPKAATPG